MAGVPLTAISGHRVPELLAEKETSFEAYRAPPHRLDTRRTMTFARRHDPAKRAFPRSLASETNNQTVAATSWRDPVARITQSQHYI